MDNLAIIQALTGVGLSEKVAHIYVALLGKRRMTISQIAKAANVKRATCYEYIDQLLQRDFVTRVPVGKRMFYSAQNPRKVLSALRQQFNTLENSVEAMEVMHNAAINKPRVVYLEGKREIQHMYADMFKTVGELRSIFPAAVFFENFSEQDYDTYDKALGEHALKSKDLFVRDRFFDKLMDIRRKNGNENKIEKRLPEWFKSNVDVLMYSDKVALVSLRDLSATVIENKDIADLFRNMHELMWKSV